MRKCYVTNLGLILTEKCNLDCSHCMRGKKTNHSISNQVLDVLFDNLYGVHTLSLCGGEITLAIKELEEVVNRIFTYHLPIEYFTTTINGTIYSEEMLRLFQEMNQYIGKKKSRAYFAISFDSYHIEEIKRLGLENQFYDNLRKYQESPYFYMYRFQHRNSKLFREGNAENFDEKYTTSLEKIPYCITYSKNRKFDVENGLCNIGPLVCISVDGIVTECDSSNLHQKNKYNYGNILDSSLEEIILNQQADILKPKVYEKECQKRLNRYY